MTEEPRSREGLRRKRLRQWRRDNPDIASKPKKRGPAKRRVYQLTVRDVLETRTWLPDDAELWLTCWDDIGQRCQVNGKSIPAYRFAYESFYGETLGDGETVEHLCWNSMCCNPMHLTMLPHRDNSVRGTLHNQVYCLKHREPLLRLRNRLIDEGGEQLVEVVLPFCVRCQNASSDQANQWLLMMSIFRKTPNEERDWYAATERNHGYVCWLADRPERSGWKWI